MTSPHGIITYSLFSPPQARGGSRTLDSQELRAIDPSRALPYNVSNPCLRPGVSRWCLCLVECPAQRALYALAHGMDKPRKRRQLRGTS